VPERHTVVATYRDLEHARDAMAALERAGIGSTAISLEGEAPDRAAEDPVTTQRDLEVTGHLGKRAITGGIVGALVGGLIGLVAGAIAFGGFEGLGIWAAVIGGVIAGGAVGGVMAGLATPAITDEWELTHDQAAPGEARVRVESEDRQEADRAADILWGKEAVSVEGPGQG
jgi:predicted lipid-binding transport protein (Tim44 family)